MGFGQESKSFCATQVDLNQNENLKLSFQCDLSCISELRFARAVLCASLSLPAH